MSFFYTPKRSRNLFDSESVAPYKLSRSKIELFLQCPRCFYIDRKLGVARPPTMPFNLNNAVDHLLKKEFDTFRAIRASHPLMVSHNIEAIPFSHPDLDKWRENFQGISYLHTESNFLITGAIDDIWIDKNEKLHIVDYKATSKESPVTIDASWQISYRRQMDIYAWLFKQNGFSVADTGYFVYCNALKSKDLFDQKLHFSIDILPYEPSTNWVDKALIKIKDSLSQKELPKASDSCDFCLYRQAVKDIEG